MAVKAGKVRQVSTYSERFREGVFAGSFGRFRDGFEEFPGDSQSVDVQDCSEITEEFLIHSVADCVPVCGSMAESDPFRLGEIVVHPRRPEWGDGVIDQAMTITHEGKPAQRLIVRFANHGQVTINTGVAPLLRKEAVVPMRDHSTIVSETSSRLALAAKEKSAGGWLDSLGEKRNGKELYSLPEAMTDPFASLSKRLQATLDSYRFSTEPRSLIDWGVVQTGLNDPLSKYTRHDLEQAFPRFARDRDQHLVELVRQIKRQGKAEVFNEVLQATSNATARNALQRAMRN